MEICIDETKLKEMIKETITEVLEERKGLIYEVFADVIEDMAMARAIEEGEATGQAGKREVLDVIRDRS